MTFDTSIMMLLGFTAPFVSGVVCLIIIAAYIKHHSDLQTNKIAGVLFIELTACVMCWASLICFLIFPQVYKQIEFLFFAAILYAQVFTFRFIFLHTRTVAEDSFSRWNYLLPLIPMLLMLVCSLVYSYEDRMFIRFEQPPIKGRIALYTSMVYLVPLLFLIYNIYYSFRSLFKISRYSRLVKEYSADEGHSSQRWLYLLIVIALSSLPLAIISSVMGVGVFFSSLLTVIGILAIVGKDIVLTYNTITYNYVLISIDKSGEITDDEVAIKSPIDRTVFERHIHTHKPYLNPSLRITDLAQELGTNRTYLSVFINTEYGTNFSRYINRLRLNELDRLRRTPSLSELTRTELIDRAGFSNYQGYVRSLKNETLVGFKFSGSSQNLGEGIPPR
ncbi:MAG: AraC family transcriptional regulator [Alistipes sp.]